MKASRNRITSSSVRGFHFPASEYLDGSDATNEDSDYSATYIVPEAESGDYGFILNLYHWPRQLCLLSDCGGIRHLTKGKDFAVIRADAGGSYNELSSDSQARWLGPEKGCCAHGNQRHSECLEGHLGSRRAEAYLAIPNRNSTARGFGV